MKMRLRLLGCTLAFGIFANGQLVSQAVTIPSRAEVSGMLKEEQFAELEKIAGEARHEKLKFYQDDTYLEQFYRRLDIRDDANDQAWAAHLQLLEKWAKARPDSPTPLVALGNFYESYAWKARGSGYANTVTDEGWRLFRARLERGKSYLDAASRMSEQDPEGYRAAIVIAMGLSKSKEEVDAIFKKGIAADRNYLPLYYAKAYYLLPRWMGEPGDWERFAAEAADARGGDEGDMLYMIIARSQSSTEGPNFFRATRIFYPRMKRGFEASLKYRPDYAWERNSYCYFACIAGDKATAKTLFEKIGDDWARNVWREQSYFQVWRNWALHNGPAPVAPGRYTPTVQIAGDSGRRIKTILIIGGAVWVVLMVVVGIGFWFLIRGGEKRS
jgi:hypothetical protein